MLKIIIILTTLISCVQEIRTVRSIDSELEEYVLFAENQLRVVVDYPVIFKDESKFEINSLGYCRRRQGKGIEISINKGKWGGLTDLQKEILIIHEMGHCSLDLDHTERELVNLNQSLQCPGDIMQEGMFNHFIADTCYYNNLDFYIERMLE